MLGNTNNFKAVTNPDSTQAQVKFQQALAFHRQGEIAQAHLLYEEILKIQPSHFDALHALGVIAFQTGNPQKAVVLFGKALEINPNAAAAYCNRGFALHDLRQFGAALESYDKAIALNPDYAEAYNNRGITYQDLRKFYAALDSYDKAIAIKPDYAEAFNNRGFVLHELKQFDAALASYDKAIAIQPGHANVYINRGNTLKDLKQFDAALANYDKAIALKPDYAEAFDNRGHALQELGHFAAALASYDKAIAFKPGYAGTYLKRGNALKDLQQYAEALASYDQAIAIKPDYIDAYNNRGMVLQDLKQFDAALTSYDQAIAINPDYAQAHWNKSLLYLQSGYFDKGWKEFEWRWKWDAFPSPRRNFAQPLWLGEESLAGKTILLHSEQGLGDAIQFCRYAKMVAALGARVILEVHRPLLNLFSDLEGVTQLVARGSALPEFDYHCPLLSLPLAFKTNIDSIPSSTPYLFSDAKKVERWQVRLGLKSKPRIGLVWSGNPHFKGDHTRSIPLAEFVKLLPAGDFQFISLQKEIRDSDKEFLRSRPDVLFFGDELSDFTDTAALCECVDLVVSTCTSVPHLSCALGRPTWILLSYRPDWRWLLGRNDSPWYPTAKLYWQEKIGDWDGLFGQVKNDLIQLFSS